MQGPLKERIEGELIADAPSLTLIVGADRSLRASIFDASKGTIRLLID
jgi:hypothetical protein